MAALVVGLAFGFALTLGGAGWSAISILMNCRYPLAVAGIWQSLLSLPETSAAHVPLFVLGGGFSAILLLCGGWMWPAKSNLASAACWQHITLLT